MSPHEYPDAPRVAVGAIVIRHNRVLLVKRRHPPSEGQWALPGGGVKLGETLEQAVERELKEETGVIIRAGPVVYTLEVIERDDSGSIRFHYVIVDLLGEYVSGTPTRGDDAIEARWVEFEELNRLPVNKSTLKLLQTGPGEKPWNRARRQP